MRFFNTLARSSRPAAASNEAAPHAESPAKVISDLNSYSTYKIPVPSVEDSIEIMRSRLPSKKSSALRSASSPRRPAEDGPPTSASTLSHRHPAGPSSATGTGHRSARPLVTDRVQQGHLDPDLPPYEFAPSYADVTNRNFDSRDPASPLFNAERAVHVHSLADSLRILRAHNARGSQ